MDCKYLQDSLRGHRCYLSLACSIGSISLACGSLLQIPNITDRISLQRGLFLTSLGFIYFVSLTDFCNKYLLETQQGQKFRKKYRLMISDVMEITNKIVSSVQAAFSFLVGFLVCKATCSKSFVYASHFLMEAYGWFGTAYFMYDIWSMYKVHTQKIADKFTAIRMAAGPDCNTSSNSNSRLKKVNRHHGHASNGKYLFARGTMSSSSSSFRSGPWAETNGSDELLASKNSSVGEDIVRRTEAVAAGGRWNFLKYIVTHPVIVMHHIFIGTFGLLVVTYIRGGGHCIYSYMFMMEFSTPFVSLRSILSTLHLKDTRLYIANGLLMLATFFACRVFMWPYVLYRYSLAINSTLAQSVASLPRGCILSILILFLPQLYWFLLMVRGALKVFFPNRHSGTCASLTQMCHRRSKGANSSSHAIAGATQDDNLTAELLRVYGGTTRTAMTLSLHS